MTPFKNHSGQSVVLLTLILSVVFSILLYSSLDLMNRNNAVRVREIDRLLLDEVTSSSFAVVEAALERRLWEPPPDASCLKSENFSVTTASSSGPTWTVNAKYNFDTRNFELVAKGEYKKFKSSFKKQVRVVDVSDYLLYSGSEDDVIINQSGDPRSPAALIAKDRKIYTNGKLLARAQVEPRKSVGNQPTSWSDTGTDKFPDEYGMILQGERLQFKKGLSYTAVNLSEPEPAGPTSTQNSAAFIAMLAPFIGSNPEHYGQHGGGNLVILKDSAMAENLEKTVKNPTLGLVTKSQVAKSVYPIALFSGNPPLLADSAVDSGSYFNQTDRYMIFRYYFGNGTHATRYGNYTCLSRSPGNRSCSYSERFPRAFNKWRSDADVDGVLLTSEAVEVPVPKLGWDQLESLEEEAAQCGKVVDTPVNTYVDCPVWDIKFITNYSLTGAKNCMTISKLNLDTLGLNNFSAAQYATPEQRKKSLRRVVYLKNPTTLTQTNANGFMAGITDPSVRSSISLWVVSEKLLNLQGYQQDQTSPLDVDSDRTRKIYFNSDAAESVHPIALTFLSPEKVHLLSPFYVPMSPQLLEENYPVVNGRIQAERHNLTDYKRWENDGYKYGFRTYVLKNINMITSLEVDASSPVYLQGLWSGPDGTDKNRVANQCMMTRLGQPIQPLAGAKVANRGLTPTAASPLVNGPNPALPPLSSRFYNGSSYYENFYSPAIFQLQLSQTSPSAQKATNVEFIGGRIHMKFDFTGHPTKPDLIAAGYDRITSRYQEKIVNIFDLSGHGFEWDLTSFYVQKPPDTPCVTANVVSLNASVGAVKDALSPSLNDGGYVFIFKSAADDFKNSGAFTGIDLPMIESNR